MHLKWEKNIVFEESLMSNLKKKNKKERIVKKTQNDPFNII